MTNELIKSKLIDQRNEYLKSFKAIPEKENILKETYSQLEKFDFEEYKSNLEIEVSKNLKEWWTNQEKGIIKEEELFSILFEYDHFYAKDVEALSYGIGKWKDYKVQTEEFDMGFDYDFTTEFYAAPGISLTFFDPLEQLDYSNLPERFKEEEEIDELEGFEQLIQLFKFNGMIAIHEVFNKMDSNLEFEELNYKDNFMFIIDEHDSSEVYPILIKNK